MAHSGFRRILIVNGHGGNSAVQQFALEWAADHPECRVIFHNWWNAPRTWAKVQAIDPVASHGSWMENFPWTRLPGVNMPATQRPMVDMARGARARSGRAASVSRRRQLRRPVSALGRGDARAVAGRGRRDTRAADRLVGLTRVLKSESTSNDAIAMPLIWGAGAIGGTLGAYLARAGHDVTLVDTVDEHVDAIDASTACASPGRSTSSRCACRRSRRRRSSGTWDDDHPRHEGASHRRRRPRAAPAPHRRRMRGVGAERAQRARDRRGRRRRANGRRVRQLRRRLPGAGRHSLRRSRRGGRRRDRRPHHAARRLRSATRGAISMRARS